MKRYIVGYVVDVVASVIVAFVADKDLSLDIAYRPPSYFQYSIKIAHFRVIKSVLKVSLI